MEHRKANQISDPKLPLAIIAMPRRESVMADVSRRK